MVREMRGVNGGRGLRGGRDVKGGLGVREGRGVRGEVGEGVSERRQLFIGRIGRIRFHFTNELDLVAKSVFK